MSLSFSIDRILSPDFGPCKSRALDSTVNTNSAERLPADSIQGLCKSEDFSYKKLVEDTCMRLEMPPSTEMHAGASLLCQMISAFPSHSVWIKPNSKFFNTKKLKLDASKCEMKTDDLILLRRNPKQHDLERCTTSNDVYVPPCSEDQSGPLAKVANFIEDIFDQKVIYDKNTTPLVDSLEQSSSLIPYRLNSLAQAEQNKPLPGNKLVTFSTKETSPSPKKDENTSIKGRGVKDAQPLPKPHLEEDNFHPEETNISSDTKPRVPEELCQKEDWCLSADGRCSASSVDTLSSRVESDSNDAPTISGFAKPSPEEGKIFIKESLSDTCVDSPPSNFCDSKSSNVNPKLMPDDLDEIIPQREEGWPVWVYCSRYSARPSSGPRSRRQSRKMQSSDEKRCRTAFTMFQLNKLHMAFESNPYLCEKRRNELARDLQLSESQVKIWFQNRRAKVKKASGSKNKLAALLKEQGLYNHSTTKT